MGGRVDRPANHLKIPLARFVEEIRRHQVAANGKLPRADFHGFLVGILDLAVEQQAAHECRVDVSQAGENDGIEGNHHHPEDFPGFAKSADQGVLAAPEAAGFQLQVEDHIVFLGKYEYFFKGRNALSDEFAGKPGARIEAPEFRERHMLNRTVTAGGTIDGLVMNGDKMRVARQLQVGLDEGDALCNGSPEGGKRIFRSVTGSTAMGYRQHAKNNLLGNRAGGDVPRGARSPVVC